jgi:hypothetical protein
VLFARFFERSLDQLGEGLSKAKLQTKLIKVAAQVLIERHELEPEVGKCHDISCAKRE